MLKESSLLPLKSAAVAVACLFTTACGTRPPAWAEVTAKPTVAAVRFDVHADRQRTPISPLIYGINGGDFDDPRIKRLTFNRGGGNRITAYNWENNASNAGSDFQNQNDGYLSESDVPGAAWTGEIAQTLATGASYVLSVPMEAHVSADKNGDGDVNLTPDFIDSRFVRSLPRKNAPFTLVPNLTDKIVYQDEFVHFLKIRFPSAFSGAIARIAFMLDNEPDLWAKTHRRLRGSSTDADGAKLAYAELFERSEDYAAAIKDVAPNALVFGPASYGWSGYRDLDGAPDANGRDFLDAYLSEMISYEAVHGRRLLDVLDLHWYPEATGGGLRITEGGDGPAVAAARLQAPRSLDDPTYTETSWIAQSKIKGPINLIPRIKAKIAANYPGTKLSFSEYNYGGPDHISGGVGQADVLGIFGTQGVYAANLWPLSQTYSFILGGFEMFRNFDGRGSAFGDTSVQTTTTDGAATAIYASVDAGNNGRMVLVMINRSDRTRETATRLRGAQRFSRGHAYRLDSKDSRPRDAGTFAISGASFELSLPAFSVTTVELK
nr:glycoside hydrolase family 44 protein [Xanthomonas hortorum]